MAAVKELSAIFLFHFFLKLYLGEITVVCGKSEQSGHYDGFALYNTAASATTWLSHAHQEVICDLLISFLKLYFGQIATVSCKSDYLTSRLATFFFTTQLQVQLFQIYIIAKIHGDKV